MTRKSGKKRPSFQEQVDECYDVLGIVMTAAAERYGREVITAATTEYLIAMLAAQPPCHRDDICASTCDLIEEGVNSLGAEIDAINARAPEIVQ